MLNSIIQFEANLIKRLFMKPALRQMKESHFEKVASSNTAASTEPVIKANNLLFNTNLVSEVKYEFAAVSQ